MGEWCPPSRGLTSAACRGVWFGDDCSLVLRFGCRPAPAPPTPKPIAAAAAAAVVDRPTRTCSPAVPRTVAVKSPKTLSAAIIVRSTSVQSASSVVAPSVVEAAAADGSCC